MITRTPTGPPGPWRNLILASRDHPIIGLSDLPIFYGRTVTITAAWGATVAVKEPVMVPKSLCSHTS